MSLVSMCCKESYRDFKNDQTFDWWCIVIVSHISLKCRKRTKPVTVFTLTRMEMLTYVHLISWNVKVVQTTDTFFVITLHKGSILLFCWHYYELTDIHSFIFYSCFCCTHSCRDCEVASGTNGQFIVLCKDKQLFAIAFLQSL